MKNSLLPWPLFVLALTWCGGPPAVPAATTNVSQAASLIRDEAKIAPDGEKFLFVVETSSDTRKMEPGCRQAVFDLVFSGINGQMRQGDTFGIWTFNQEVYSGQFPMTVWEPDRVLELAGRAAGFLKSQKYSRSPNLEELILSLRSVSQAAGNLNVFLVSSGDEPMIGTPYDEGINSAYKTLSKQRARAGKPLITTFVVRKTRLIAASVAIPGDRITLPARPPSRPVTTSAPPATAVAAVTPPASTNVAAAPKKVMKILTRSNTLPATATIAGAPTAGTTPAPINNQTESASPPATAGAALASNANANSPTDTDTNANANADATSTATVGKSEVSVPVKTAAASVSPSAVSPEPTAAPTPAGPSTALLATPGAADSNSGSGSSSSSSSGSSNVAPSLAAVVPNPPPVTGEGQNRSAPGQSLAKLTETLRPAPITVAAREVSATATPEPVSASVAKNSAGSSAGAPLGLQAVAVPQPTLNPAVMLAIGGVLLAMATFLVVLVLRRGAPAPRTSLITQSMDRG